VLELRGEFPTETMPTEPRLMGDPRQFLTPHPPGAHQIDDATRFEATCSVSAARSRPFPG
jgi:hypothetical protein